MLFGCMINSSLRSQARSAFQGAGLLKCFQNRPSKSLARHHPGSRRTISGPAIQPGLNTNIAAIAFLDIDLRAGRDGGLPCGKGVPFG